MKRMKLITHPDASFSQEKIYRFKTKFQAEKPTDFIADIFADARYKLYLNGNLIAVGPCRGNSSEMYYDNIQNSCHLKEGENILEAVVLQLKNEFDGDTVYINLGSVPRTGNLRFALKGTVFTQGGTIELETDENWETVCANGISFEGDINYVVGLNEVVDELYFADADWKYAKYAGMCVNYECDKEILTQRGRYTLNPAPIPPQRLDPIHLEFDENGICDAGELMTAYTKITLSGKGTVSFKYAECRVFKDGDKITKSNRIDSSGIIDGYYDVVSVNGENIVYEPFWFRTFRFISAEITGDVKIEKIEGLETGYPLNIKGFFECGSETDCKLWEISLRTLKRCIQETYTDCPYYEQEQYLMDTRMQALFTYQVSNDDRLIRRTLRDFASVQQTDGMLLARTPDVLPQIIPGFSFYYIFILYDHYMHFADLNLVKSCMPTVCGVLKYFSEHLSDKGLVKRSGFWDFVDWVPDWADMQGTPSGDDNEDMAIYSLMYATALKRAAFLQSELKNNDVAKAFTNDAEAIKANVKRYCFDENKGLFADGPTKKYFSAHAQIWAVLSDTVSGDEARSVMENSSKLSAQPTFCYTYDYFRALEKCGMYENRRTMLDALRNLVFLNCTTIPETPVEPRSECHGWGATVLYEFTASDLGVRLNEPERTLCIAPYIHEQDYAKGHLSVPGGDVYVEWKKSNGKFIINIESPKEYLKKITLPDGSHTELNGEKISLKCTI